MSFAKKIGPYVQFIMALLKARICIFNKGRKKEYIWHFWIKLRFLFPMWTIPPKSQKQRLVKDLQLGLCARTSPAKYHELMHTGLGVAVGQKAKYLSNKTRETRAVRKQHHMLVIRGGPYHQSAFLSDSDIMRMLLTTISRRWCKKLPNWLSQSCCCCSL